MHSYLNLTSFFLCLHSPGIKCPLLTPPVYAIYDTYETLFKTKVTVTCMTGFTLYNHTVKTIGHITCNSKARWEGDPLDCVSITCTVVPSWGISLFNSTANVYGSYINISCPIGSELADGKQNNVHFCNLQGEWTPSMTECQGTS